MAPADLQIAFNRKRPADSLADLVADIRTCAVPVECQNENDKRCDERSENRQHPREKFSSTSRHRHEGSLPFIVSAALAVPGPSGSGKSVFLRMLALLDPLDAGHIEWHGKPVSRATITRYRRNIAY